MKRNGNAAFVSQMLVYALVMISCGGGVGLGTVWLRQRISVVANENKVVELRLADLRRQIDDVEAAVGTEERPEALMLRNEQWRLGLVSPVETHIERVADNPVMALARKRDESIFAELGGRPPLALHVPATR